MNAELPPFKNGEPNSESTSIIDRVITPLTRPCFTAAKLLPLPISFGPSVMCSMEIRSTYLILIYAILYHLQVVPALRSWLPQPSLFNCSRRREFWACIRGHYLHYWEMSHSVLCTSLCSLISTLWWEALKGSSHGEKWHHLLLDSEAHHEQTGPIPSLNGSLAIAILHLIFFLFGPIRIMVIQVTDIRFLKKDS